MRDRNTPPRYRGGALTRCRTSGGIAYNKRDDPCQGCLVGVLSFWIKASWPYVFVNSRVFVPLAAQMDQRPKEQRQRTVLTPWEQ